MNIASARRLRILFLANRVPYPIKDGQTRRTYHVLKGLAAAHDVHLLSLYETPEEASAGTLAHLRTFCERVEILPAPPKSLRPAMVVRLIRSLFSSDPYTVWRHYSRRYVRRVREAVRSTPYDVVHCDILPLAYAVRGLKAAFTALTDHDVSFLKAQRMASQQRNPAVRLFMQLEARKLRRLEQRIFSDVDLGIVVSDVDRALLEGLCPGRPFAVVENGVDLEAFAPDGDAVEPHTLVWVGGLQHYSNFEAVRFFLEEIYPRIKREDTGVKLLLVGATADRLADLIAHDSSVVATGFVDDPAPYIRRGAIFVAPILSGSGTKLKLLEAMAAARAIVSTSIGVEGIVGQHGQHYMVADQPEVFAAHVLTLLRDRSLQEQLGANARAMVSGKYGWALICEKMSEIYGQRVLPVRPIAIKEHGVCGTH